jgi:type I restriction enzyme S subunit
MRNISQVNLRRIRLPVPPANEAERIVRSIETALSTADQVMASAGVNEKRCTRLRQSILKWAFEGRLVDQDPSDEPASVLLDRIRAEREAAPGRPSRSPRRTPAKQGVRG